MSRHAVVLDSGESLFDETRTWAIWADWIGVPPFTLFVALGGVLARGRPAHDVFRLFRPDFDYALETARRSAAGSPHTFRAEDVHPDVVPALTALRRSGYEVYVAGNLTAEGETAVRAIGLPVTGVVGSDRLGRRNSEPEFFQRLLVHLGLAPSDLVYVGHRLDTAIPAARRAGLRSLYLQRGPIAYLLLGSAEDRAEEVRMRTLAELPVHLGAARTDRTGEVANDAQS